jgi:hypothetical protein
MSYPPPPPPGLAPGAPSGKPRLRGRTPLRLAIIFLIVGVVGVVAGGVVALNGALKKVDNFERITVPTAASGKINSAKIDFGGTGGFIAYYESKNAKTSGIPAIPVRITSPSGKQQDLTTPYGGKSGGTNVKSLSYNYNGHNGVALWQFTVSEKGTYTVEVAGSSRADGDATMAFGRSIGKSTVVGGAIIAVAVLLLIAGIILLIIGLVKRSHSKKELAAAQGGYGPPAGYGFQQPPGQQYPPPGPGGYPPGQQYPPQGQGGYPPPGQQYPPPGQQYPSPGQGGYPPPGQGGYPPPGYQPQPDQSPPENPQPENPQPENPWRPA